MSLIYMWDNRNTEKENALTSVLASFPITFTNFFDKSNEFIEAHS